MKHSPRLPSLTSGGDRYVGEAQAGELVVEMLDKAMVDELDETTGDEVEYSARKDVEVDGGLLLSVVGG